MSDDALGIIDARLDKVRSQVKRDVEARLANGATIVSASDGKVSAKRKLDGRLTTEAVGRYGPARTKSDVAVSLHVRASGKLEREPVSV